DAQTTTWPVMGWFRLYCANVSYNTGTDRIEIAAAPASPSTGIIGPNYAYGGTYYNRVVAATGQALGGFSGRSGAALDKVIFEAYSFTQGSLTLNAVINPGGGAVPGDFTLIATDSGSVAVNFTSGETKAMTPSNYTLSWTGPAGYTLNNLSCTNPFILSNGSDITCTYTFDPPPSVSGFVFNDDGSGGGSATNGIKDGSETGLGIAVPIVAYNTSTGLCYATTSDPTTGAYSITLPVSGTYKVYEAVNETNIASPTCPPTAPTLDTNTGSYVGGTIGDPSTFQSSSANIVTVSAGVVTNVNFGDFAISSFDICSSAAYLTQSSGGVTQLNAVNLATGSIDLLTSPVTAGSAVGYSMVTNTLAGMQGTSTLNLFDSAYNTYSLSITNSTMPSGANNGDIDDNGILYAHNGGTFYLFDTNPNSETYLTQVGTLPTTSLNYADIAFNPIDGFIYSVPSDGSRILYRFNPTTGVRTSLGLLSGIATGPYGAM
ncbi:hypothetical protein HWA77_01055, partial [Photobacterium damselae subsp. damselae]|nr:hypothetical protein [Photobacterium damselae subsp. damselae]